MQRSVFFSATGVLLVAIVASGCGTTPHLDRQFGHSVALLRAQQVLHPQAVLNRDPASGIDGRAANAAYETYQKSFSAPPAPAPGFTIGVGAGR